MGCINQDDKIFSNPAADFKGLISARFNRPGRKKSRAAARTCRVVTALKRLLNSSGWTILP
jgi:hypothetical protein